MTLKMGDRFFELGVVVGIDEMRNEGFEPRRRIDDRTWRYDHKVNNRIYYVVEQESKGNGDGARKVMPIRYFNLDTGEVHRLANGGAAKC